MIQSFGPQSTPLFSGKTSRQKPSWIKTALVGSLLASAGAQQASQGPIKRTSYDKSALQNVSDPFSQDLWDSLTLKAGEDSLALSNNKGENATPKASRKLLTPPSTDLSEKAAQSTWNASTLTPLNYELFSQNAFPNTSRTKPAPLTFYDETSIKLEFISFLNQITNGNATQNKEALAVFNDPILKTKAPDPKIRAALATIKALGFDEIINAYKSDQFSEVKFNDLQNERTIAYTEKPSVGGQQKTLLNLRYQGEDWRLLIETLGIAALRQNPYTNDKGINTQALIAEAIINPISVKLLLLDPSLVTQGTELARSANTGALYRLSTRGPNGELRLLNSTKPNVLPLKNFAGLFDISKPEDVQATPGNPLLASLLKIFTGKTVQNPNFDWDTIQLLDQNQKYLSYNELLEAANVLELNNPITNSLRPVSHLAEAPAPSASLKEESDTDEPYEDPYAEDAEAPAPSVAKALQSAPAAAPAPSSERNNRKFSRRLMTALGLH